MTEPRNRVTRIGVSNYRSLGRNQETRLGRITVLVGPNGAGKSNVADVLSFVRDAMHKGLSGAITERGGIDAVRRWSTGRPYNVSIKLDVVLESGPGSYSFEITGDRREEFRVKSEKVEVSAFRAPRTALRAVRPDDRAAGLQPAAPQNVLRTAPSAGPRHGAIAQVSHPHSRSRRRARRPHSSVAAIPGRYR